MIKSAITLLFLFISIASYGQKFSHNDSLIWDVSLQKKLMFHFENPGLIKVNQKNYNIGVAELSFQTQKGEYRRAKAAYDQKLVNFDANGISQIDDFIISGSFKFNKIWEDSLANSLQGLDDDMSPFYYFVEKPGKYERQNFNGNVQVRYAGFNPHFQPGFKIIYGIHWTTRSVDPRPRVGSFGIKFNPFVTSQFGSHHFTAGVMYGYGDEETNIAYKNTNFNTSLLYPDRIHYTNQGFGYISQKDSADMRKYDQYWGINIGYSLTNKHIELYSSTQFDRKITNSTFDQKMRKTYFKRNEFTLTTIDHHTLLLVNNEPNVNHIVDLSFKHQKGKDFNYNLNSANYLAKYYNLALDYHYNNKNWSIGAGTTYIDMTKIDAAADHFVAYSQLGVHLNFKYLFDIGKNILETELIPKYLMNISNVLEIPSTQVNVFTKNIVYPDFDYFNLEPIGLNLNLAYNILNTKNLRGFKIFLHNQFYTVLDKPSKNTLFLSKDKYDLWQTRFGLQFNL